MPDHPKPVLIVTEEAVADRIGKLIEPRLQVERLPTTESAERLLERVAAFRPDTVIIDRDHAAFDWATAVHAITGLEPRPNILVLGGDSREEDLLSAFREGADAYLPISAVPEFLTPALQALADGSIYFRAGDAEVIRDHMRYLELGEARDVGNVQNGITKLTVREKEVFPLLADGRSIKETARTLGISPKTVETHKYRIMQKLGLTSMADFTKLAMIKDLIPL